MADTCRDRKEYMREWNKKNKDKRAKYTRDYWYRKLRAELSNSTVEQPQSTDKQP